MKVMNKIIAAIFPVFFLSIFVGKQQKGIQYDGPYVLYTQNHILVKYVFDEDGLKTTRTDSFPHSEKNNIILTVATDEPGKTFSVKLKSSLQNEKSDHGKVSKQFVVSDIEGNFKAFRMLLQANGVIDEKFDWTFGDGHLVLTGDFFDRGDQQTEVLWLIYSLEEKAKAAGGYVHYVLGNHEIMNMSNDHRYVHPKYKQSAAFLGEKYLDFYGKKSELGQWLCSKNVAETVGDVLYVHGGISALVNEMSVQAAKINKIARPFYMDTTYNYSDRKVEVLYSDQGPFWYRGYYAGTQKATEVQIDNTLSLFKVKHIATGHTVIADTISVLFNGKVFNTDVHHSKGHSEALLIEDGKFYRANAKGEKFRIAG
jgi:Calcineurin-like phosphoesterase